MTNTQILNVLAKVEEVIHMYNQACYKANNHEEHANALYQQELYALEIVHDLAIIIIPDFIMVFEDDYIFKPVNSIVYSLNGVRHTLYI